MQYIFEVIQNYQMIEPGMKVVAGVSGGADSVCLLYVLKEYQRQVPFELIAVHVEHGIRGQESLEDADFTQSLCQKMGVPCHTVAVPVRQLAREAGLSEEETGRRERYRIFEEVRVQYQADRIAVAHNRNDQAETLLWNLARGSGLKGLGGILPVRDRIIRPLLFTDRKRIEEILRREHLTWRTDRTNLEQDYTRNRIRLSLIPQMEKELNARAGAHIAEAAHKLQQVQAYLDRMTEKAVRECLTRTQTGVKVHLDRFFEQDELIRLELFKRAVEYSADGQGLKNVGSIHYEMLAELAHMDCGRENHLPGGIRVVREAGILHFSRQESHRKGGKQEERSAAGMSAAGQEAVAEAVFLPVPGEIRLENLRIRTELLEKDSLAKKQIVEEKKYTKWLSYDTITNSVRIRKRRAGDYLVVNEQGGRKKLKDYFIDCKIPKDKRDQVWLLADGSHVLWVIGYRISAGAKVKTHTQKILKVQIEEEQYERES